MPFGIDRMSGDRGQVGISFLIVFIALVLVAAIAAGLFIQTAGVLEERASNTGDEATDEVSNQIQVMSAYGETNTNGNVQYVFLNVERAAGAGQIDLSAATVDYQGPTSQIYMTHAGTVSAELTSGDLTTQDAFYVGQVQGTAPVLSEDDDLLQIGYNTSDPLPPSTSASVTVNTANGGKRTVILETPMQMGASETVEL